MLHSRHVLVGTPGTNGAGRKTHLNIINVNTSQIQIAAGYVYSH